MFLLDTPLSVGDLDIGDYTHTKILAFNVGLDEESLFLSFTYHHGRVVAGKFIKGDHSAGNRVHLRGQAMTDFVAQHEGLYNQIATALYALGVDLGEFQGQEV